MKKGKNKAMDGVKITPEIIAEMRDVIFSLNTAMDAASTIPASAFVGRDVSRLFNLAATQARAVISKLATTQSRQERETATLHAQLGEARAELERVQTANNGDSSLPHFDSVVIPTEADADIKALGALLTPEGLGLYNRIARRNYDARRRERDELRAELLTTHQMACRVGLERDELRAKQGEAP